ncbi:MAG: nucleotidyltransferase [Candidatus Hydrogenedentes bacterium]|nr:nucleotidyltransferase [Candidatus Hydrogenedentota bacterium]
MISNEVRYMLIGGIAVGYYGYLRTTGDIDLWVDNSSENGEAVAAVLTAFGISLSEDFTNTFQEAGKVFRMGCPPMRIEIITGISGVKFNDCYPRRKRVEFDDIDIDIIDLEDLKVNKKASGRTNDIDDLAHLP